ncbi:MAG: pilus assembly protein TadG-related protein [Hyphomicrobiaceae bacterium]
MSREGTPGADWQPRPIEDANRSAPVRRFCEDEGGTVAILFSLTLFLVVALIGGAIDFGRAITTRNQLQNALDASALAAGRTWQTESDMTVAEEKARLFFSKNSPYGVSSAITAFTPDVARNAIVLQASASIPAPFLSGAYSIVDGRNRPFEYISVTAYSEAALAVGGNSEINLEISMMLDVTGSMDGTKIRDLKLAAKDLIDIVVWSDQSEYTSRVALVPFANGVNLGSTTLVNNVRGALKTGSCTGSSSPCTAYTTSTSPSSTQWTWGAPAAYYQFTNSSGNSTKFRASSYCVSERIGTQKYSDAAPTSAANRVGPVYQSGNSSEADRCSLVNTSDLEVNAVMPLSSDKTELKQRIDKLEIAGSTAGQIGTAWAWYMLAPNWAYLWPSANRPVAYNTEKTQKIAVLMTDGEYNTAHCNGVLSKDSANNGTRINCNATNAISDTQADQMCAAMKTGTGITVYTVGFALGGNTTAINTLRACASDTSKFYEASDGDELRQAFRDIALQIAKLRLTQ